MRFPFDIWLIVEVPYLVLRISSFLISRIDRFTIDHYDVVKYFYYDLFYDVIKTTKANDSMMSIEFVFFGLRLDREVHVKV